MVPRDRIELPTRGLSYLGVPLMLCRSGFFIEIGFRAV